MVLLFTVFTEPLFRPAPDMDDIVFAYRLVKARKMFK